MSSNIDLHIHTNASDGTDSPAEVLEKALALGIRTFSITDHDTIDGSEAIANRIPAGIRYIQGIEFSCTLSRGKCHILGYGYDPRDPVFLQALDTGRQLRQAKLTRRLAFLEERFGIVLTEAELAWIRGQKSPGKPHLGSILVSRGLAADLSGAIRTYLDPCRGGADRISAALAVRAISHAGGIPIWAHPLGGEGERRLSPDEFHARLSELTAYGIRGMECFYSRYAPADRAFLLEQAAACGLLVSGGSDYHGSNKVGITPAMLCADHRPIPAESLTVLSSL